MIRNDYWAKPIPLRQFDWAASDDDLEGHHCGYGPTPEAAHLDLSLQLEDHFPMSIISASPAYGRDYTSGKAIEADWKAGKDFRCNNVTGPWVGGQYFSSRDTEALRAAGYRWVNLRYKSLSEVHVIKL